MRQTFSKFLQRLDKMHRYNMVMLNVKLCKKIHEILFHLKKM